MSFIIEQQAQFTVGIQLLKERQADSQRLVDADREMIRQLVDVTMSLAGHAQETDLRLRELAEAGTHTERRLDALIDTVDKLVRRTGL
ncbi:MAG: hypothetical protein WB763_25790 [Terriglobia bacterium]